MSQLVWLRLWVGLTGLAGLGAAIGALWNPSSPIDTIYRNIAPESTHLFRSRFTLTSVLVAAPIARMYATWLLLSTVVRFAFMVSEFHLSLALVTLATYVMALMHFFVEIFVFQTVPLKPGGQAPLVVASISICWLSWYLMEYRKKKK